MTTADPTGVHDWHADGYVRDWIERQDDESRADLYLRRLVNLIPRDPDGDLRVLDIGSGYGALAKLVLEVYPHARVVVHDYSEPMLAEARARFASVSDSVSYFRSDLLSSAWATGIDGSFDAVVSSIAIHNVRYPERIRGIFHEVAPLVAPGGCFLNFDYVALDGPAAAAERHAQMMERRAKEYEATGVLKTLREVESEISRRPREARGDDAVGEPGTLANQLRWLREAGFDTAECFWRDGRRALIGGFKAP